jgi:ankyrin repeat protein
MKKLENAIRAGDIEKVRKLIAAGVDVSAAFADGTKPIQLAAQDRQVTILRALAAAGADLADLEVLTPEQRLNLFLDSSLDLQSDEDLLSASELSTWAMQAVAEQVDENFITQINSLEGLLLRAARTDNLDLLKEGLAAGEDVNQISEITRDTALSIAVQKADEEMVEVLLAAGANVNHAGFSTPLSFALPHLWLAKLLLDAGADAYGRGFDLRTPLERAVDRALSPSSSYDSPLLVRFFLEAGVDPVSAESCAGTLLEEAVYSKAWEMHQELLPHYPEEIARSSCEELEFDKGLKEIDGGAMQWTFDLRYEARGGHLDKLREVLARQPQEVNFAKEIGLAVLAAVSTMELKALPILIEAGADLNAAESYEKVRGSSPLAAAAESWHRRSKEAMRLLIDAGADVDQRGHCQRTPLMYAVHVAYRHGVVLKKAIPFLLQAGADLNLEDQFGHTAWTLAKAPLIEQEEPSGDGEIWFEGPDLSELLSDSANQTDQRRSQLDRCREALELLEAAGATAHVEG